MNQQKMFDIWGQKILYEKLIRRQQIKRRIGEMAIQIAGDNCGNNGLIMIGALNGVMPFLVNLSRKVGPMVKNLQIETVPISSYGLGTVSSGEPVMTLDPSIDITGKRVLFVDDLVDSGHSIRVALENLKKKKPASLKVAVLFSKPDARKVQVPLDYVGFEIPNKYVTGVGLDDAKLYRWLLDLWARK